MMMGPMSTGFTPASLFFSHGGVFVLAEAVNGLLDVAKEIRDFTVVFLLANEEEDACVEDSSAKVVFDEALGREGVFSRVKGLTEVPPGGLVEVQLNGLFAAGVVGG